MEEKKIVNNNLFLYHTSLVDNKNDGNQIIMLQSIVIAVLRSSYTYTRLYNYIPTSNVGNHCVMLTRFHFYNVSVVM